MKKAIFILLVIALACFVALAALRDQPLPSDLEGLYDVFHQRGHELGIGAPFSGVVLVARDGEIVFQKAYGHAEPERKTRIEPDSKFIIGASAKPFTAALVLKQVKAGKMKLEGTLADYVPAFPEEIGRRITLHQLLTHTSGLPRDRVEWNRVALENEPGKVYGFSNLGYELLVAALEGATGQGYGKLLDETLAQPIGLQNTGFIGGKHVARHPVGGMRYSEHDDLAGIFKPGAGSLESVPLPREGVLYSTASDMLRFVEALKARKLLPKKLTDKMLEPGLEGVAYGWRRNAEGIFTLNPEAPLYSHVGRLAGHNAIVAFYDDGTTVVVLSNVDPIDAEELLNATYLAAHDTNEVTTDLKHPSLSNPKAFRESGGVEAFLAYYRTMSDRAGYPIRPSSGFYSQVVQLLVAGRNCDDAVAFVDQAIESWPPETPEPLNDIGYAFLFGDRAENAVAYFKLNTELFPEDANAYDSLGECQQRLDQVAEARGSYERAIELAKVSGDGNLSFYEWRLRELDEENDPVLAPRKPSEAASASP